MKKTLIALAAVSAVTAVSAQSAVTVYGRMDLGYSSNTTKNQQANTNVTKVTSLAGAEGQRNSMRLGFRGTEDLGGGLRAGFNIETALNADAEGATFGNVRLANLSLSGGFGTVVIGTYLNSLDTVRGFSANTFAAGGAGGDFTDKHSDAVLTGLLNPDASPAATLNSVRFQSLGRSSNAIAYVSPAINGFTFSAGVNDDITTTNGVKVGGKGYMLSAAYAAGPLNARIVVADNNIKGPTSTTAALNALRYGSADVSGTAFAVSYNLGVAVPYIIHETAKAQGKTALNGTAVTSANTNKSKATEIGARFPMGAFTPYVTYGKGEIERAIGGVNNDKTTTYQLGTTYDLSKRTSLYFATGKFTEKDKATGKKDTNSGTRIGLIHQF